MSEDGKLSHIDVICGNFTGLVDSQSSLKKPSLRWREVVRRGGGGYIWGCTRIKISGGRHWSLEVGK